MKMNELPELDNVLDSIIPEDEPILSDIYASDFIESLLELMTFYIEQHPTAVSEPDFHDDFKEHILEFVFLHFEDELYLNEMLEDDIDMMVEEALELFFITIMPIRSFSDTCILSSPDKPVIENTINYLRSKPQPAQRTDDWYKFRHNLITASNAYKAFENQSTQNQLIYEKCQPIKTAETVTVVNVNTTLHWGQKFEPLSVMIYEHLYNTKIEDFGCIQHDHYYFLGASPDGINVDPDSDRYGRMLEIKNIVNREINGIPKKEYWIQTQLQMEVCNLDECDFLETQFKEYDNHSDYINDVSLSPESLKGFFMYFSGKNGKPLYIYKPLTMNAEDDIMKWEEDNISCYEKEGLTWIKNIYWKLECISCVLILRNRLWFDQNIIAIQNTWEIIENERQTGCDHRAPNRRIKKEKTFDPLLNMECFLKMDTSGKTIIVNVNKMENVELKIHDFFPSIKQQEDS